MTDPEPEPSPEGGQPSEGEPAQGGGLGDARFTWVPGSEDNGVELSGPVPPEQVPNGISVAGGPEGLDWQALFDALAESGRLAPAGADQDEVLAEETAARDEGRMSPPLAPEKVAALAVEHMKPGPAMAGWLSVAAQATPTLDEDGLTGLAGGARKQAAHAHAVELTAVGQIAARAAAADRKIGLGEDGRPVRVCRDAVGQVEMALTLSHEGAERLADLAVTLTWRLPDTGAVLAAGWIDLDRAKIIAQYTSPLSEEAAREVEAKVLPVAPGLTCARLRERLAKLVIAVDPAGAEERRKRNESYADVRLYGDDDQTATLIADKLPQILAAAGYNKINALARARKKSGLPGSLGQHRTHVLFEMILGNLDLIPPAEGDPPDEAPPPDEPPPPDQPPPSGGSGDAAPSDGASDGGASDDAPDDGTGHGGPDDGASDSAAGDGVPRDELPEPRDEDAPEDDGLDAADGEDPGSAWDPWESDDDVAGTGPSWPTPATIPAALARTARSEAAAPPADLLDVTLPWSTYTGLMSQPGTLGRIGAITPDQARQLAQAAERDPAAQWRIIVTDHDGRAVAVTRIRRRIRRGPPGSGTGSGAGPPRAGPRARAGPVGRVTLIISEDTVASYSPGGPEPPRPAGSVADAALKAAARALQAAREQAEQDSAAGGCAHTGESLAYRPPPRLREHVIARDLTCCNPVCGQPAWRSDLDHTIPYDQGGRTCRCNVGGACRRDHQLKQHPRWKLRQTRPGWFEWTAPSGRTYSTGPTVYLA
jgi:hypothetical protein